MEKEKKAEYKKLLMVNATNEVKIDTPRTIFKKIDNDMTISGS